MMMPKKQGGGMYANVNAPPSTTLWVGNLPAGVNESELAELFRKYGLIEGITCYSTRNYAFVYYNRVHEATSAKKSLQGFLIRGSPIKIEFAKPAKLSKHVWVGAFGPSTTKEKLEAELRKFGPIEEFKFFRDRNTALVDFARVEDAASAVKNLNGFEIGLDRIRVDFLRSHAGRREQSDLHDMGGAHFRDVGGIDPSWTAPNVMRNYREDNNSVHNIPQIFQTFGGHLADQPSKVLWVGYPPSVVINEEMLHNAMILYGEIENIICFPDSHHSFVEFRSVEEARRAKEALQGRLFNDARIVITFSNSDFPIGRDFGTSFPRYKGHEPDMVGAENHFRPPMMDGFPPNHGVAPKGFTGPQAPNGLRGPVVPRSFAARGSLDLLKPSVEHSQRVDQIAHPPSAGFPLSPNFHNRTTNKRTGWDVLDPSHAPIEVKRSKVDGTPFSNHHLPKRMGGEAVPHGDDDYIWRGAISKGGTPVCRARCIPIGKGLECALPEVVNCSARTGLDMLTKHCAGAIGYDIVFFLPDSEDDFANYTEFLRYLGSKNRAGVAKLDDGTTLFLVPPSNFLTDVLKVSGQERLYGVVLKLPQQVSGGTSAPQQQVHQLPPPPIQCMDSRPTPTPQNHVCVAPPVFKDERGAQMDYGSASLAERNLPSQPPFPFPTGSVSQNQSDNNVPSTSHPGLVIPSELLARLANFLPGNAQTPVGQSGQPQLNYSSTSLPSVTVPVTENEPLPQGWNQQHQVLNQTGQSSQQITNQAYYNNPQLPSNFVQYSGHSNLNTLPIQNPGYNFQGQGSVPSSAAPPTFTPVAHPSQQYVSSTQGIQQSYHFDAPNNTQNNAYDTSQQPQHLVSYTNPYPAANLSHSDNVVIMPSSTGNSNMAALNQVERPQQMVPPSVGGQGVGGQGAVEVQDADRNQRYQSTLQLAANLLLQIQQKQEQGTSSHIRN